MENASSIGDARDENDIDDSSVVKKLKTDDGIGSVVASHYNKLEEKGKQHRKESRIYFMRNLNNWIKSMLIQDYVSKLDESNKSQFKVLDIGCGKGGDLLKWSKYPVGHMVGVDIAETSIDQCKDRYQQLKNKSRNGRTFIAEFYAADCTKTEVKSMFRDPDTQFNIVSCQFAFHYCFESYQQADTMLKNITSNLKQGGYFIGTTPCSYEIMSRLQKSGGRKFGNSVYSISFDEDTPTEPPALFGAQYNFHLEGVVDCPEFLVYFPILERMAKKYGLMLISKERFGNYFDKKAKVKENVDLMKRMSALESYPSHQLMGEQDQYRFAEGKITENGQVIGTLSEDEWEALNIYTVFAFKKMNFDL